TGVILIALGLLWVMLRRSTAAALLIVPCLLVAGYILLFTRPHPTFRDPDGNSFDMLYSQQSGIGLLQVLDFSFSRHLLINGVLQGQMGEDGHAVSPYIHAMDLLAGAHCSNATSALQLGLGAGLLPKELVGRGVKVTA